MTFGQSFSTCMRKYATFSGRASRSEFWWFWLFTSVVSWGPSIVAAVVLSIDNPIAAVLFGSGSELPRVIRLILGLPFLLPMWAVGARRLHDIGKSGWWQLIYLTGIGTIVLYVWYAIETDPIETDPIGDRFNSSDTPGQELPESAEQEPQNFVGFLLVLMVVIAVVGVTLYRNQGSVVRDSLESERSCYVRLYRNIDNTWVQIGQDLEGEAAEDDQTGVRNGR